MSGFCPETDRLAEWLEGTLPESERSNLARHLAKCDECRRATALAASALEGRPEPLPAGTEERWLARLRRPRVRWWSYAAAAGVLLAFGLVLLGLQPKLEKHMPGLQVVAPKPEVVKETPKKVEPRREEPRTEVADKNLPNPKGDTPPDEVVVSPPNKAEPPTDVVKRDTKTDLSHLYEPLALLDGSGDLWMRKAEGEQPAAKVKGTTRASWGQVLEAREGAAAFTVEGQATVAIEPKTSIWVARSRQDAAYVLGMEEGVAFVDTEGTRQAWQFLSGATTILLPQVYGRIFVEALEERLNVHILQGRVEISTGGARQLFEDGAAVSIERTGKLARGKADSSAQKKRLKRLGDIRPTLRTAFLATFEEEEGSRPFRYSVNLGELRKEGTFESAKFLMSEAATGAKVAKAGPNMDVGCGIHLDKEVKYLNGMYLRFQYRTTVGTVLVRAGKYSGKITLHESKTKWMTAEVPIEMLESEGVPIVSGEPIREIYLGLPRDAQNRLGTLEVDNVELIRSARFAK